MPSTARNCLKLCRAAAIQCNASNRQRHYTDEVLEDYSILNCFIEITASEVAASPSFQCKAIIEFELEWM